MVLAITCSRLLFVRDSRISQRKVDLNSVRSFSPVIYAALGGIIGVLVLHPVNSLVVWMEYASLFSGRYSGFGQFAWERVSGAPLLHLMAMNVIFAALGAIMGLVFSVLTLALSRQARTTEALLEDLHASSLPKQG